jgi:hypothetical protein
MVHCLSTDEPVIDKYDRWNGLMIQKSEGRNFG